MRFLAGRDQLFADRLEARRIVDGHGDLLAEDIFCLPEGPQILDCLEFDDRLRWVDGLDDAAFLAMDLEYHGRPDLAAAFLEHYAEFAGIPPGALSHHYMGYRAAVREKVACVGAEQVTDAAEPTEARRYAELALRHLERAAVRLVLVGGLPGTGKPTIAGHIASRCGMVVLSSDRIRKELAGLDPAEPVATLYRGGIYGPEMTEQVYAELLRRADTLLRRGESVVLDASCSAGRHREWAAAVAERTCSDEVALRCHAPAAVAAQRLSSRSDVVSDADESIASAIAADEEPWPQAHDLSTDRDQDETLAAAIDLVVPTTP